VKKQKFFDVNSLDVNEIENVHCVETNFWKPSRLSIMSRSTFFFSVEIF